MSVKLNLNTSTISKKIIKNMDKLQPILNTQVIKDSNYYAPKAEGTLQSSAIKNSDLNAKQVKWVTAYAHRLYNGVNFEFSTDANSNARAKWFEEAKTKKKKEWIKLMNTEYNKL